MLQCWFLSNQGFLHGVADLKMKILSGKALVDHNVIFIRHWQVLRDIVPLIKGYTDWFFYIQIEFILLCGFRIEEDYLKGYDSASSFYFREI